MLKRKTAKEVLAESFKEIAEYKAVDKITVVEIAENCGYSTTTFYRHFHDKYDLMAWEYIRGIETIVNNNGRAGSDWRQICLDCTRFFREQKGYLKNLLQNTNGFDSFSRYMMAVHYEGLKRIILKESGGDILDLHMEMVAKTYCHGAVDMSCDWIMDQYDVSDEEMVQVYIDSLPEILQKYLMK